MLEGKSKLYKHPRAATLYLTIPSDISKDSQFGWKAGDQMKLEYNPETDELVIKREGA